MSWYVLALSNIFSWRFQPFWQITQSLMASLVSFSFSNSVCGTLYIIIRELKQRRFWATQCTSAGREEGLFPLNMPWREQICIAKFLRFPENLGKNTAQECKVHFLLTCVSQKRVCLSSPLRPLSVDRNFV